ncbi:hypothetical protein AeMF1_003275 [Aphanomyces euteiches]|nr:hypothetical protein AeMF1_003275 [Aphanomyces euteiches]KAH9189086.1 hypothetical protein AeNC1_008937 [Aphanomyces euteiches]
MTAERFASGEVEFQESDPRYMQDILSSSHSQVLLSWQSPLCAETIIAPSRSASLDHDPSLARFQIQYWTDASWSDLFRSFAVSREASDVDTTTSILPGNVYTDDCFVVLDNAKTTKQLSYRVRSRVDNAIFQLFKPQWSVWSDIVVLPPAMKEAPLCQTNYFSYYDAALWCITVLSLGIAIYTRWSVPRESMRGAKRKLKALQEEVTNLKQELIDAESENKQLMRLKGYGLEGLSWKELHALEHELQIGLQTIEQHKEEMHPSLLEGLRSRNASADSIDSTSTTEAIDDIAAPLIPQ